ncbi:methyltransferase-like protein 22 [Sabethes cyaneus]|uniref:methyltransferase-like protein 22 n=1 Tax=Sabethes cyaneus TaxID=53552 RepID=UPI00221E2B2D|nr:methyltransferase-like protein 22 [Sabethes cyaneus]XP_053684929.1 methyltransferase-like protein 22 [Sabethes cyaneus]XP_053684930.1 methyltransferase-like protein 22 [Sabethes cyaneus]XP_053684931.1 methyltransferase-like protein 22 [Sabethes cyaneus]
MASFEVTSELYAETDFATTNSANGNSISKFTFTYPCRGEQLDRQNRKGKKDMKIDLNQKCCNNGFYERSESLSSETKLGSVKISNGIADNSENSNKDCVLADKDGDLLLERKRQGVIEIEHQKSTNLNLVGLQIWRGALLLADYILHNEKKFKNRKILELGSGVGLTSIVSSFFAREVICTDINVGGLLELIKSNITRNSHLSDPDCNVVVTELDFTVKYEDYSDDLKKLLQDVEYVVTADVIYDDTITEAFVLTLENLLLELPKLKGVFIALEKRYVFTLEDMDSVAPSYEHFLRVFYRRNNRFGITRWKLSQVSLSFPRYFEYEKVKELVLLKISN